MNLSKLTQAHFKKAARVAEISGEYGVALSSEQASGGYAAAKACGGDARELQGALAGLNVKSKSGQPVTVADAQLMLRTFEALLPASKAGEDPPPGDDPEGDTGTSGDQT